MQEQENLCYSEYHREICNQMALIAEIKNTIFVGQQVVAQDFYGTLKRVPMKKRIEMPVAEEMQMGFCTGLSIAGMLPVCIFQRMDFMYRAMDQICNHLGLMRNYSRHYVPKVIIRTTIGNSFPLDPGVQHTQDLTKVFTIAFPFMVVKVETSLEVRHAYKLATKINMPIMIVEKQSLYYA